MLEKKICHFVSAHTSIHDYCVVTKEDSGPHSLVPVFFFGYGDLRIQKWKTKHGAINGYVFTAPMTTKFKLRKFEDLKIGSPFQKRQKMSKVGFKAAQQINSDFCAAFQIITTAEQRKAVSSDIIQCFLPLYFFNGRSHLFILLKKGIAEFKSIYICI